jgi:hypothetical protein
MSCFTLWRIAVIVSVDLLFFRNRLWVWERLMVNVGIVLVFAEIHEEPVS